ncbi:MAG: uroporphyrinogen decarboxylase [Alphaproteobacteria bacterium]
MIPPDSILHRTLLGTQQQRPPFWFMRQAGRSLPEYRELRSKYESFMHFCYTPQAASEATLQPVRRFDMDAAIIFSDILVIPHAFGQGVSFVTGEGPKLDAITGKTDAKKYTRFDVEKLAPVYEAIQRTRKELPKEKSLIGFAGAPWTLLCYMIEGGSSRSFHKVRAMMQQQPELFSEMTDRLIDAIAHHAIQQAEAGADVFQLFDSWSGILSEQEYATWSIAPARRIIEKIKQKCPQLPVIAFPRQSGIKFLSYAQQSGANAISVDDSVPLEWIHEKLQPHIVVQGCLHPEMLAGDTHAMLQTAADIVENLKDKPFVFNLGHGILPHTPIENIQALCHYLKGIRLV